LFKYQARYTLRHSYCTLWLQHCF